MDDKTRGEIEHMIDEIKDNISSYDEDIKWVFYDYEDNPQLDFIMPIKSKSDFLLGYYLGRIYVQAWNIMAKNNWDPSLEELEIIVKNRLPELVKQISLCLGI